MGSALLLWLLSGKKCVGSCSVPVGSSQHRWKYSRFT